MDVGSDAVPDWKLILTIAIALYGGLLYLQLVANEIAHSKSALTSFANHMERTRRAKQEAEDNNEVVATVHAA